MIYIYTNKYYIEYATNFNQYTMASERAFWIQSRIEEDSLCKWRKNIEICIFKKYICTSLKTRMTWVLMYRSTKACILTLPKFIKLLKKTCVFG